MRHTGTRGRAIRGGLYGGAPAFPLNGLQPVDWGDLAGLADDYAWLRNYGVVARDYRTTDVPLWVPYDFLALDIETSIHRDSFNLAAMPAGYSVAGTVTGGMGADILIDATTPIGYSSLNYTFPALLATDWVFVVTKFIAVSGNGSDSNYAGLWFYDSRRNDYIIFRTDTGSTHKCSVSGSTTTQLHDQVTTSEQIVARFQPPGMGSGANCSFGIPSLNTIRGSESTPNEGTWGGAAAVDQIQIFNRNVIAGAAVVTTTLEYFTVYRGSLP